MAPQPHLIDCILANLKQNCDDLKKALICISELDLSIIMNINSKIEDAEVQYHAYQTVLASRKCISTTSPAVFTVIVDSSGLPIVLHLIPFSTLLLT